MPTDCATTFSDNIFTQELAQLFGWQTEEMVTSIGLDATLVQRGPSWAREVVVPPHTPYSAIRGPLALAEPGLLELGARLTAEGVPATLCLTPALSRRIDQIPGWKQHVRHTYYLPTGTLSEVLAACSASTRRNIRRSIDSYVVTQDPLLIPEVISLVAAAYRRSGARFSAPEAGLAALAERCLDRGNAHFMALRTLGGSHIEAGIVALHDGNGMAWYWIAGSVPGPAMSVLITHMAAFLHDQNIHCFDLMGANTPSIAEFKRRFGSQLVPYHLLSAPGRGPAMLLASARPVLGRLRGWPGFR